jgi:hypothetical protein
MLFAITPVEWLAFGTFWFWVIMAFWVVLLFALVEWEKGFLATVSVVGYFCLVQWLVGIDLLNWIGTHPVYAVAAAVGYICLGVVWGIFKWGLFIRDEKSRYDEAKSQFLRENGVTGTEIPADKKAAWAKFVENKNSYSYNGPDYKKVPTTAPSALKNKARIIRWMSFWVISAAWSLVDDFITGIFRRIYQRIATTLQNMSDRQFSNVKDDFDTPPKG